MGALDVDVVLAQVERPQVRPVQPEAPAGASGRSSWPPAAAGLTLGAGEEPVEPADHPERAGLRVGDHHALAAQAPSERRPGPERPRGSARPVRRTPCCRTAPSSRAARGWRTTPAGRARRRDHRDDGHRQRRGERRDGDRRALLNGPAHRRPPQPERTGVDATPNGHASPQARVPGGTEPCERAGGCQPPVTPADPLPAADRELHHVHEQRVTVVRQHGEPHEPDVGLALPRHVGLAACRCSGASPTNAVIQPPPAVLVSTLNRFTPASVRRRTRRSRRPRSS